MLLYKSQVNNLCYYTKCCSTSKRTKEEICSILFSSAEEITLDFPCVRKQKGEVIVEFSAYATTLCLGLNPKDVSYEQCLLRSHLYDCIQKKNMTPFPCSWNLQKTEKGPQEIIRIYCICRQPEDGKMIQCDNCQKWYHEECIQVPKNIEHVDWLCSLCLPSP